MHVYNVKVQLGGNVLNEVHKVATAPEVLLLRGIHGEGSVTIEGRKGVDKKGHANERARLVGLYGQSPENIALLEKLLGPDHMPLPTFVAGEPEDEEEAPAADPKAVAKAERAAKKAAAAQAEAAAAAQAASQTEGA